MFEKIKEFFKFLIEIHRPIEIDPTGKSGVHCFHCGEWIPTGNPRGQYEICKPCQKSN